MSYFAAAPDAFDHLMDMMSGARRYVGNSFAAACITLGAGRARMHQSRFDDMIERKGAMLMNPTAVLDGFVSQLQPHRGLRVINGGGKSKRHGGTFIPHEVK